MTACEVEQDRAAGCIERVHMTVCLTECIAAAAIHHAVGRRDRGPVAGARWIGRAPQDCACRRIEGCEEATGLVMPVRDIVGVRFSHVDAIAIGGRAPLQAARDAAGTYLRAPNHGARIRVEGPVFPALLACADQVGVLLADLDGKEGRALAEVIVRAAGAGQRAGLGVMLNSGGKNSAGKQFTFQASYGRARVPHLTAPVLRSSAITESK